MTSDISFGRWLKQQRLARDLTQVELGALVGCSPNTIRKFEAGVRRPSKQLADQLARQLELPPAEQRQFLQLARARFPAAQIASPARLADAAIHEVPNNYRSKLPAQVTSFVGREREIRVAQARLRQPDVRLLTLTGPPGVGKTRLSLRVAATLQDGFADGVVFVPLAAIRDPDLLAPAIAYALGLKEMPGQPFAISVQAYLAGREILLVLDNFEQVVAAASSVAELLAVAPGVKVLVTSRTPLHLYGEHELRIPPLAVPHPKSQLPAQQLTQHEAVALFIARAEAGQPDFQITDENALAVVEICRRLDGLPLAIELAAAHIRFFSPPVLLARLQNPLTLLTGGAWDQPARQQTIRGAIAWSYDLLGAGEQQLFTRLAVFVDGCSIEAAEAVCNTTEAPGPVLPLAVFNGLMTLTEKSLLWQVVGGDGESRFGMLETIREYALERLALSAEATPLHHQHAEYYLTLVEQAAPELQGPKQRTWLTQLDMERDNLRAALRWTFQVGAQEMALRMAGALWRFWEITGQLSEGRQWLGRALDQCRDAPASIRAPALLGAGALARAQADLGAATILHKESLSLYRELGDREGIAAALDHLAWVAQHGGDYARSAGLARESLALARILENAHGMANSLNHLGLIALEQGDYEQAATLYQESLAVAEALEDRYARARALNNLGEVSRSQGDYEQARIVYTLSLTLASELGNKMAISAALHNLAYIAQHQNDPARAGLLFVQSLVLFQELGDKQGVAECLIGLAGIAGQAGAARRAGRLFGAGTELLKTIGAPLQPTDQGEYNCNLTSTRNQIDADSWQSAWAEGLAMTLPQAIIYALAMVQPTPGTA